MSKYLLKPITAFRIETNSCKKSFCWQYYGTIVLCLDGKRKKIDPDYNYCNECLRNAQKADEDNLQPDNPDTLFGSCEVQKFASSVSTGNLIRHLPDSHDVKEDKKASVQKSTLRSFMSVERRTTLPVTQRDKNWLLARDLAVWFCRSLLPFNFAEDEGTNDFMKEYKVIGINESMPTRTTINREALYEVYDVMFHHIKAQITGGSRHGAVTFDLWTDSYQRKSYVTVAYHNILDDFTLKSYTLGVWLVTGSKTAVKLSEEIDKIMEKFSIQNSNKQIIAVTDAGANVKLAVELLGFEGSHLWLGHGLHNLVVRDGVSATRMVQELVDKCWKITRAVRYRAPELDEEAEKERRQIIMDAVTADEMVDADAGNPIVDEDDFSITDSEESELFNSDESTGVPVPVGQARVNTFKTVKSYSVTRWHAFLIMLESLGENRVPVNAIFRKINQENLALTPTEWKTLRDVVEFLGLLKKVVTHLSAESSCTMNLALLMRSEIRSCLNNDPMPVALLKKNMSDKLDHRFPVTDLVVTAALLDPLSFDLNDIGRFLEEKAMTREEYLSGQVRKHVRESDLRQVSSGSNQSSVELAQGGKDEFAALAMKHSRKRAKDDHVRVIVSECKGYFAPSSFSSVKNGDVLKFWGERQNHFPWLCARVRAVLCAPATSTPSERVFSVEGLLVTAKRSRLAPQTMDRVTFVHDNYNVCKKKVLQDV